MQLFKYYAKQNKIAIREHIQKSVKLDFKRLIIFKIIKMRLFET